MANKIEGGVGGYPPYKMKASGAKYKNSPMQKNFSSTINNSFGVGEKVDTDVSGLKFGMLQGILAGRAGAAGAAGNKSKVPSHGDEAHSGGGGGGVQTNELFGSSGEGGASGFGEGLTMGASSGEMTTDGAAAVPAVGTASASAGGAQLDPATKRQQMISKMKERMKQRKGMFGGMGMFSDSRLKEKIQRMGKSPSGIPIYEFNYIGDNARYSGAMAQDLLTMGIDAVSTHESGYYQVNYNNIDVSMHQIN
tara:strand:- start:61 stop:813 length:753 start_codon:yes stop_codon:yes gene_type:complete